MFSLDRLLLRNAVNHSSINRQLKNVYSHDSPLWVERLNDFLCSSVVFVALFWHQNHFVGNIEVDVCAPISQLSEFPTGQG